VGKSEREPQRGRAGHQALDLGTSQNGASLLKNAVEPAVEVVWVTNERSKRSRIVAKLTFEQSSLLYSESSSSFSTVGDARRGTIAG